MDSKQQCNAMRWNYIDVIKLFNSLQYKYQMWTLLNVEQIFSFQQFGLCPCVPQDTVGIQLKS